MPVYLIIDIRATDRERYAEYVTAVEEIIAGHGGRYLVRGGKVTPLSGNWRPERLVVIEFESADRARRCFDSPEYREIAALREQSTSSRAIFVEGCRPDV
jgi:uncharacterized protein (DUF1330 family)